MGTLRGNRGLGPGCYGTLESVRTGGGACRFTTERQMAVWRQTLFRGSASSGEGTLGQQGEPVREQPVPAEEQEELLQGKHQTAFTTQQDAIPALPAQSEKERPAPEASLSTFQHPLLLQDIRLQPREVARVVTTLADPHVQKRDITFPSTKDENMDVSRNRDKKCRWAAG
ncbi:hypothetical protein EYF80_018861 [Liparis tanakae]|uniref:Uncharacterized protein n=1 Tax=Liparis tanakae TaxID=230148 RepID=A0A4Z2HYE8_9TELE|nr:hypothetical protein EYF80_018861 [Liparis tanakae]